MGRILEALRQDSASTRSPEPPHTFSTDWAPAAEKVAATAHAEEEIPFIEVGSHKFFEASPGVLAAGVTASRDRGPVLAPAPNKPSVAVATSPRRPDSGRGEPRKVFLREIAPEPVAAIAADLVAFHAPDHPVSVQYRELVQAMIGRNEGPRVLLFTAVRDEAGTTTAVLNLALSAARLKRPILVIDANLRRPGVAERLGLPEAPGLRELLAGAVPLEQALRPTVQANLHALAAGLKPAAAFPRLPTDSIRLLLDRLRERFEFIFVDGPSWDGRPDLVALGKACDAVYLVLPEAEAESRETDSLCQLIPEQGGRLAGCIMSRF